MYLYDCYNVCVQLFYGSMTFMKFMFTPITIDGFETLPPIMFLSFGTLTALLIIAIVKWLV